MAIAIVLDCSTTCPKGQAAMPVVVVVAVVVAVVAVVVAAFAA